MSVEVLGRRQYDKPSSLIGIQSPKCCGVSNASQTSLLPVIVAPWL